MAPEKPVRVYRYDNGRPRKVKGAVIAETAVALTVNGEVWLTFMCTPVHLEALAVGFLYNEGVIANMDEVADVRLCEHGDNVDVWLRHNAQQPIHWRRTSGCTGGVTAVGPNPPFPPSLQGKGGAGGIGLTPEQIGRLVKMLLESQSLYRETGGVHTSALSDGEKILITAEDIGRHNTLDKIAGLCLIQNTWPEKRILLTTGRISSEMLQKAARLGAVVLISRTSPSSLSVEMAEKWGMTLIGYARRDRFNVYAHAERIVTSNQLPVGNE